MMPAPGAEMGLAAGGRMVQDIHPDPHGADAWDVARSARVFVHIVDAGLYEQITGKPAPPTPISAKTYTEHGMPWFAEYGDAGDMPRRGQARRAGQRGREGRGARFQRAGRQHGGCACGPGDAHRGTGALQRRRRLSVPPVRRDELARHPEVARALRWLRHRRPPDPGGAARCGDRRGRNDLGDLRPATRGGGETPEPGDAGHAAGGPRLQPRRARRPGGPRAVGRRAGERLPTAARCAEAGGAAEIRAAGLERAGPWPTLHPPPCGRRPGRGVRSAGRAQRPLRQPSPAARGSCSPRPRSRSRRGR